jgi:4-diphosphocytidyl-2-C-methyl-D-erythritol kinase
MSGSGATCFALTGTRPEAEALAARLSAACPGWWVKACTLA